MYIVIFFEFVIYKTFYDGGFSHVLISQQDDLELDLATNSHGGNTHWI